MHSLFIYGTLKCGFPNYEPAMNNARFVGQYQTRQAFPLVIGGKWFSPCLIDEPGQGHLVCGELFEVSDADLERLDQFEATHLPHGYRRIIIAIEKNSSGKALDAWVYVKDRDVIDVIHSPAMAEYRLDPRYILPAKRPSPSNSPGEWK